MFTDFFILSLKFKIMKALNLSLALLLFSVLVHAQYDESGPRHTISAQHGYGWFGLLNNNTGNIELDINDSGDPTTFTADFDGSAATTLAYDYRFGRVFSLGAAVGFQSVDITEIRNSDSRENISGAIEINRIFLSGRTLFHYGKNPKWDLYSGVRFGATAWLVNSTIDQDEFTLGTTTVGSSSAVFPHLVPIPFGVKYYPSDRLMIGAELATGSPHVLAFQLGVRL